MSELKQTMTELAENENAYKKEDFNNIANSFLSALNSGEIRAAEPDGNSWRVNEWVMRGILTLFKRGELSDMSGGAFPFYDKNTIPLKPVSLKSKIRIVPGGSSIRTGAYVAAGVVCMPPMYINIGAYVDEETMIDSHALVGTCAQIGKRVHLSAASQIGGVLEPPGARPVIVEDGVMIGGNCGVYEGTLLRRRAVIGTGVILNASTKVYDLTNETVIENKGDGLEIPENAVVVAGARTINKPFAKKFGLSIYAPLIVKYRDEKTDSKTALNDILR